MATMMCLFFMPVPFKSQAVIFNSQLVRLLPVGMFNYVTFI